MIDRKVKKELSDAFRLAIGYRSISEFIDECGFADPNLIIDIVNENINVLPNRKLFRLIEMASEKRVTYSYLCQICGYSEYYTEDDSWKRFAPNRGSIYYIDLGYNNLDSEQNGIRPCLIISNDLGNKNSCILSVAPLTTKSKKPLSIHVKLGKEDGMRQDSIICLEQTRVVSKRRLFYNRIPIKIMDLSEEKIFEVNTAIEKQFGLIDCLYNSELAFELVEQINSIKQNKTIKKSNLLKGIYEKLNIYCKKYNRDVDSVIEEYEESNRFVCAI